jgi:hypothetical protein
MLAFNMEDRLTTVYYWVWDVWEEELLCVSYILLISDKFINLQYFDLKDSSHQRKHQIVSRRRVKTLDFFLFYKTRLLKATSWRCSGKAHDETANAYVKCKFSGNILK